MQVSGPGSTARPRRLSDDQGQGAPPTQAPGYQEIDIFDGGLARGPNLERRRNTAGRGPGQNFDAVLDIEAPPQEEQPSCMTRWWRACRAHPYLRYVPVYAACATTIGAYFGIRNWLYLDAAKTYGALQNLRPLLVAAHEKIACALQAIQTKLNVTEHPIDCPQQPMR